MTTSNTKNKELRKLSEQELIEKLNEVTDLLDKFYFLPKEKIEKPRLKSELRHQRARILTFLGQLSRVAKG